MKKQYFYYLLLALPMLLSSCFFEEKDIFDLSASERMEVSKAEAQAVLVGAENGWHVRYFPNPLLTYGGYNLFFKFEEDGSVTVASEIEDDPSTTATSLYSMGEEQGVTVALDTQNALLDFFIEPMGGLAQAYQGMVGDYTFTVVSATPEEVILYGIRSTNKYILTPIAVGVDWATEMAAYKDASTNYKLNSYSVEIDGVAYQGTLTYHNIMVTLGEENYVYLPFIYTKTGISFYEPVTINGVTAQDLDFTVEEGTDALVATNGANFKIIDMGGVIEKSDNTFEIAVGNMDYKNLEVTVTPSNDDDYYYVTSMMKSEYDTYASQKELVTSIFELLNADLLKGTRLADEVLEEDCFKGATTLETGNLNYHMYDDEDYEFVVIAFGCGVSDGGTLWYTTDIFEENVKIDPAEIRSLYYASNNPANDYKKWLGKWTVTSGSSIVTGSQYTFDITIVPDVTNSTLKINGWGMTAFADVAWFTAYYYNSSTLRLRNADNTESFGVDSTYGYFIRFSVLFNNGSWNWYNAGYNTSYYYALTYSSPGTGKAAGNVYNWSSGWDVYSVDFLLSSSTTSNTHTDSPMKDGITTGDYTVAPYTFVQTVDGDGKSL